MFKYLSLILSANFITPVVINNPIMQEIAKNIKPMANIAGHQFYNDFSQRFTESFSVSDFNGGTGSPEKTTIMPGTGTIFNWSDYADSWSDFSNNYQDLTINAAISISFMNENGSTNTTWNLSSFDIPLSAISDSESDAHYQTIKSVTKETTHIFRGDDVSGALYYYAWQDESGSIYLKFATHTSSTIDWNYYNFSINTKTVSAKAVPNYSKEIYQKINDQKNIKGIFVLKSDYSRSLEDSRNWEKMNIIIKNMAHDALGNKYQEWENTLFPEKAEDGSNAGMYSYSDSTGEVSWTIKFTAPTSSKETNWIISLPFKISLSGQYDANQLGNYLTVNPSKVVDINNPNGPMIFDSPEEGQIDPTVNNATLTYHSTIDLNFAAAVAGKEKGKEYMTVNDKKIDVSTNSVSTVKLEDKSLQEENQKKGPNTYVVKLFIIEDSGTTNQFTRTYIIKQAAPNLSINWYAWDPNGENKKFLEQQKARGSKINEVTGTISQTIWVHNSPPNGDAYPYDPLNQNGSVINDPQQYDKGYLAEAITSFKAIQIVGKFWDDKNVTLTKTELNPTTLQVKGTPQSINKDDKYEADNGIWLFTIKDKGFTSYKIVRAGNSTINDSTGIYEDFLSTLPKGQEVASEIWSTMEGTHLKFYLNSIDNLNGQQISKLDFENIDLYWKEYVSDAKSQRVPPQPGNLSDLSKTNLNSIKVEAKNVTDLENQIGNGYQTSKGIFEQINNSIPNLIYQTDYKIDFSSISDLLNFDNSCKAQINIKITALPTSLKIFGVTSVTVFNYKSGLENAVDLSKIAFDDQNYDFSTYDAATLKAWIIKYVASILVNYPYINNDKTSIALQYDTDYLIKPLDDKTLTSFISSPNDKLVLTITSGDSPCAINATSLTLVNNPKSPTPPPDPSPGPDINPIVNGKNGNNLIWVVPIVIVSALTIITSFFWFKYRRNKKIK